LLQRWQSWAPAKTCPCFNCRLHAVLTGDKQNTEEDDCELCQDKSGSPSIFLLHKDVHHTLGQQPEAGCLSTAEESWVTVRQPAISAISAAFEAACSALPVFSGNIYPSQVTDGEEDWIATVSQ